MSVLAKNLTTAASVDDPRWIAVQERDPQADGRFYYAVKTTGVYCRPSCAARLARIENVSFYSTCEQAEAAGYRACLRCKPDQRSVRECNADRVAQACAILDQCDEALSLDELASRVDMSPYHFHRVFKSATGLTPRQYAAECRANRVRKSLAGPGSVTTAIFDAGYSSSSRFYERSDDFLGMTPSDYRAGGTNVEIRFAIGECVFGTILAAASDRGVCAILLGSDPQALLEELQDRFGQAQLIGADPIFESVIAKVIRFVEAPAAGLDLPLDVGGTIFQRRVWHALAKIPLGETMSYAEVANSIGAPKSARAVAIPCHRVVRSDGGISGYRWGVEVKRQLLEREAAFAKSTS
ncbi:MAG: bifunctional DNA-binding transcriptional regulator/O6-methylguanine-DNA methyltransferase Ada [Proteobacteria bacterium]|nr:bifunctional DNA-binding transcriptional regulator/O6-methylguanine-DNA methyltransferase Ada [Pseudomonadota bacterium]